jgi:hypothetical protein
MHHAYCDSRNPLYYIHLWLTLQNWGLPCGRPMLSSFVNTTRECPPPVSTFDTGAGIRVYHDFYAWARYINPS